MVKQFSILIFSAVIAALVGCGGGTAKHVGTWTSSRDGANMELALNADNSFTMKMTGNVQGQEMVMNIAGSYTIAGDKWTVDPKSVTGKVGAIELTKEMSDATMAEIKKDATNTIKFISDTEFESDDGNGKKTTFKKK